MAPKELVVERKNPARKQKLKDTSLQPQRRIPALYDSHSHLPKGGCTL